MTDRTNAARVRRWLTPGATALALAVAGVMAGPVANADTILVKDSPLLYGSQTVAYSMKVTGAGSLAVALDDLNFPTALADLSFALATSGGVLQTLTGEGDAQFDVDSAGTYWAIVSGRGLGKFGIGQLSLSVVFSPFTDPGSGPTPVPLPGALALLLAGLAGTFGVARKRESVSPVLAS
jgi:hypothetical protein